MLADTLGIEKTSIHLMRHTFAKNYYLETHDIYSLRLLLGHSSIAVTEHYLLDLGLTPNASIAYNPQALYVDSKEGNKRRKKNMT